MLDFSCLLCDRYRDEGVSSRRVCRWRSPQLDAQPHLLHLQQRLGVAACIVDWVMAMPGLAQSLEIDTHILLHPLVERPQVGGTVAKGIPALEVVEVPVDELPVKAVVVGNKHDSVGTVGSEPAVKRLHYAPGIVEGQALLTREAADGQGFGVVGVGDRLELTVEGAVKRRLNDNRPETDHGVVDGDGAVGFDIDHKVRHVRAAFSTPPATPVLILS